ncbi:MAG: hypothetical protein ACP5N7_05640 [Candidatus Pacearchaeota archaeon]
MSAGKKLGFAREVDSGSWMDDYSIALADAANLVNVHAIRSVDNDGTTRTKVTADYVGTGAITLANYAGLPKYSLIYDWQAEKIHVKLADSGTSTWKSTADIWV